ncbi:hypothetical protein FIBSPDRAFT_899463 [Athelia psychrophila]|uniref:Uncharacterized protein n=1 Tax=Athelia psychrophila TaxID=1759441 RepID=A0A165ZQK5_9AGAM|nr:hypothetical protein FIBSPDRAFT_899463 [Fibularhizoctonia sp. CBS 109695]
MGGWTYILRVPPGLPDPDSEARFSPAMVVEDSSRLSSGGLGERPQLRVLLLEDNDSANTKGGEEKEKGACDSRGPARPPRQRPDLSELGETQWDVKWKRHVRMLAEAVMEYKRRHKHTPPKGLISRGVTTEISADDLLRVLAAVREVRCLLASECNQIHSDLAPSGTWSLDPADQRRLQPEHELHIDVSFLKMTLECKRPGTEE